MAASMISSIPSPSLIFGSYPYNMVMFPAAFNGIVAMVPYQLRHYLLEKLRRYLPLLCAKSNTTSVVAVKREDHMAKNELFAAVETYLYSVRRPEVQCLEVSRVGKDPGLIVRYGDFDKIEDSYQGIHLEWRFVSEEKDKKDQIEGASEKKKKHFQLSFDCKCRDAVLDSYLPWVVKRAEEIRADSKKIVRLHSGPYESINLEHPSTFETLAMEPEMKKMIVDDLDRFLRRKDFYKRVGKAWKRGYLLYGPPGTGKSSLIAAMANYLKFDIYDMELANIHQDSDLRGLFVTTPNRSIIVIEDIDCTVKIPGRKSSSRHQTQGFTLSGLLNFIDGLWSSCGDERIIIFTTNNKERLEPALLRPGRMDMHIHMSYLTPNGFNILAKTYLHVHDEHPRLPEIGDLIKEKNVTPAEIAEELMKSDDVDACLDGVVEFLKSKTATRPTTTVTVEEEEEEEEDYMSTDENIKSERIRMPPPLPPAPSQYARGARPPSFPHYNQYNYQYTDSYNYY